MTVRWVAPSSQNVLKSSFEEAIQDAMENVDMESFEVKGLDPQNQLHIHFVILENINEMMDAWTDYFSFTAGITLLEEIDSEELKTSFSAVLTACFGQKAPEVTLLSPESITPEPYINHTSYSSTIVYLKVRITNFTR